MSDLNLKIEYRSEKLNLADESSRRSNYDDEKSINISTNTAVVTYADRINIVENVCDDKTIHTLN